MTLEEMKRTIAVAWIIGAGLTGLAANVSSMPAAIVLAVLGFGPPLVTLLLWNDGSQAMSESVQESQRLTASGRNNPGAVIEEETDVSCKSQ